MEKMNLYQKLVEVRKQVSYLQKSAEGYKFKYATESQILSMIRPKMDEMKVILEMDMISLDQVDCCSIKDKQIMNVRGLKATFKFIWVDADNPSDRIEKTIIVQEQESCIETVGSLMTYAHRYFLYKFFSVPTDKDDPDTFDNKTKKIQSMITPTIKQSLTVDMITEEQAENLEDLLSREESGSRDILLNYFTNLNKSKNPYSDFLALTKEQYEVTVSKISKKIQKRAEQSKKTESEAPF